MCAGFVEELNQFGMEMWWVDGLDLLGGYIVEMY
jgi:hypothetical protein